MDKRTIVITADSEKDIQQEENQETDQEKVEVRKALNILARYFLYPIHLAKLNNGQITSVKQTNLTVDKNKLKDNKSTFGKSFDNIKKRIKTDHNVLLDLKAEIQSLIDFHSPRIEFREFPQDPFSKSRAMSKIFQLIILDKEPVPKLVLCSKCRKILVRYRPSGTNLIRHYHRHMKSPKQSHQDPRQSGKTKKDEYREKRAENFPKLRSSNLKPKSDPRNQRKDLPSCGNDQSLSSSSGVLSGFHTHDEAININPEPAIGSLPAAREDQVTSKEGDSKEELGMLIDHPLPMAVGVDNTRDKTCAQIKMITENDIKLEINND